jgi:Co/Zn/Cd efflux system component
MMAGIMIMEALAVFLILPTIGKLWDGEHATAFNMTYIAILAVAMTVASFLQFRSFADPMNIVLQVLLLIGGIVVHPIVFIVAVLFIAAWWYTYYLRGHLKQRMERGLLPAQHVWVDENKDSRM